MKKLLSVALICCLVFAFAACRNDNAEVRTENGGVVEDVTDTGKDVVDGATDIVEDTGETAKDVVEDTGDAIKDAGKEVKEGVENSTNGTTNNR